MESGVDTRGSEPILTVADRSNNRIQTFTLDGQHVGFVEGVKRPCDFHRREDIVVVPDLGGACYGSWTATIRSSCIWGMEGTMLGNFGRRNETRSYPESSFAPHAACFDPDGNIFVVEYVEVGRVTKLRKIDG